MKMTTTSGGSRESSVVAGTCRSCRPRDSSTPCYSHSRSRNSSPPKRESWTLSLPFSLSLGRYRPLTHTPRSKQSRRHSFPLPLAPSFRPFSHLAHLLGGRRSPQRFRRRGHEQETERQEAETRAWARRGGRSGFGSVGGTRGVGARCAEGEGDDGRGGREARVALVGDAVVPGETTGSIFQRSVSERQEVANPIKEQIGSLFGAQESVVQPVRRF